VILSRTSAADDRQCERLSNARKRRCFDGFMFKLEIRVAGFGETMGIRRLGIKPSSRQKQFLRFLWEYTFDKQER